MRILLILLALLDDNGGITKIAKENSAKTEAEKAYQTGDYKTAIERFTYLTDTLRVEDEKIKLNLGHAFFKAKDFASAAKSYEKLYSSTDKKIRSVAAQQLGVISYKADNDKAKALAYFKESLRANPANNEARYNYELLKKQLEKKEDPKMNDKKDKDQKQDQKEDQQKQNQDQKQEQKGKDQQKNQDQQNKNDQKDQQGKQDKDQQGKDGKEDKNGQGNKDSKEKGKEDNSGKDGKDGEKKDKQNGGNGDKDKNENGKNGEEKQGGDKDKNENAKANQDPKGESVNGKDDQKDGKQDQQGQAMKEGKNGKKAKEKIVANPEMLAKMGLTQERAQMLLDAMKGSEVQYIQQQKREPTTKKNKKGKPDW